MEQEIKNENCGNCGEKCCGRGKWRKMHHKGGGMGYCMGFIGAAIYYIQSAPTFWAGVIGVLKAAVWPAFLVYGLLGYLGM